MKGAVVCFVATIAALQWTNVYGHTPGVRIVQHGYVDFGRVNNGLIKGGMFLEMDNVAKRFCRKHPSAKPYFQYMRYLNRQRIYGNWNNYSQWARGLVQKLGRKPTSREFANIGRKMGKEMDCEAYFRIVVRYRLKLNPDKRKLLNTPAIDFPIRTLRNWG
uniref:Egg-lysin n=1 Tax=Tegula funebralis TaxID=80350 RepID=Q9Y1I5_TEGFU|nr:sperm lysin precusor [Tegula funebralis]